MIEIQSGEQLISFLEFSTQIPKELVHAMQVYAKVRDGRIEKSRTQWLQLYKAMMKKTTN